LNPRGHEDLETREMGSEIASASSTLTAAAVAIVWTDEGAPIGILARFDRGNRQLKLNQIFKLLCRNEEKIF
jgi:hypothetical protein